MPSFFDLDNKTPGASLVAGPITAYLESQGKALDEKVLHEMEAMFRKAVVRQLMQPRESRKHYESNSLYSFPCARKSRYIYDGTARPPLQARTLLKFLLGDMVELTVMGMARLAGLDIGMNNADLWVTGLDGVHVPVHPDGLLCTPVMDNTDSFSNEFRNCEVKSCDSNTFDRWLSEGGPRDDFGYRTQATVEIQAWREAGMPVDETVFVAVSTGSRQGSIAEWVLPYEPALFDAWQARRALRQRPEIPPVPFEAEDEVEFRKGRAVENDLRAIAAPRHDKNGNTYGWDIPTGRQILPVICSYCDFKDQCWPGAAMELKHGKPVWVVPASSSAQSCSERGLEQEKGGKHVSAQGHP